MTRRILTSKPCPSCHTNQVWDTKANWWVCPVCDWDSTRRKRAELRIEHARQRLNL